MNSKIDRGAFFISTLAFNAGYGRLAEREKCRRSVSFLA